MHGDRPPAEFEAAFYDEQTTRKPAGRNQITRVSIGPSADSIEVRGVGLRLLGHDDGVSLSATVGP